MKINSKFPTGGNGADNQRQNPARAKIKTALLAALSISGLFLLTALPARADWAPVALPVGARITYAGVDYDGYGIADVLTVLSSSSFADSYGTYTYTYKKTSATAAQITYTYPDGGKNVITLTFVAEGAVKVVIKRGSKTLGQGGGVFQSDNSPGVSPTSLPVGTGYELVGDAQYSYGYYYGAGTIKSAAVMSAIADQSTGRKTDVNYTYTKTGGNTARAVFEGLPDADEILLTFINASGASYVLKHYGYTVSEGVLIFSAAVGTAGQDVNNTLTVSKQTLGGLSTKGVKLSAPSALAVPKGTKLFKGAKAVYTWKRDGVTVGTGKSLTVKQSGEYTVTLSYKRADGGTTTTTADIANVTIYAAPKITSLTVSQTTDTLTSSALKNTSVVSGESLSLTVSIAQTAGAQFGPFNYKWYRGSALVRTQQSSSASDTFVTPAYGDKADAYKVEVETVSRDPKKSSKPLAVAKSKAFKAKVILPPSAVTLKLSANPVKEGKPLTLSATAKGTATLIFTWYKNDVPIATGSAKKFTKKPVSVSDAGVYYVVVSQDKTNRRAQSAPLTVSVQRADGTIASGVTSSQSSSASSSGSLTLTSPPSNSTLGNPLVFNPVGGGTLTLGGGGNLNVGDWSTLTLSRSVENAGAEGGDFTVSVMSTSRWHLVSGSEWLLIDSEADDWLADETVSVRCQPNAGGLEREGELVFENEQGRRATLTVRQEAGDGALDL